MILVGKIMKRQEDPAEPLADTTYLVGVAAQNLGRNVGETVDLVPLERLEQLQIPEWALAQFRQRFPEAGHGNETVRQQLEFWHRKILPQVLRGRR